MITKMIPKLSVVVRASARMELNLEVALCEVDRVQRTPARVNVAPPSVIYKTDFYQDGCLPDKITLPFDYTKKGVLYIYLWPHGIFKAYSTARNTKLMI